jgi:nitroimidazol reductase NimA-like FMN-containing flavoprotein (pyridoxamine 5'-phosphate oxidase superfamily)
MEFDLVEFDLVELASERNAWVTTIAQATPELVAKARRILQVNRFCTLSTCSPEGWPWASPLLFASDRNWQIYWSSATASLHSQNLIANQGRAAIVIYDSTATTGNVAGLFLTGQAMAVPESETEAAMELLFMRLEQRPQRSALDYLGDSPRRMYQFRPEALWLTGERVAIGNQLVDTKVKLNLADLI